MDGRDRFDRLDLDNHLVFHNDISAKPELELNRTICHGDWLLADLLETPTAELQRENRLIDGLQQTRPERRMYTVGRVDNLPCDLVLGHLDNASAGTAREVSRQCISLRLCVFA